MEAGAGPLYAIPYRTAFSHATSSTGCFMASGAGFRVTDNSMVHSLMGYRAYGIGAERRMNHIIIAFVSEFVRTTENVARRAPALHDNTCECEL